MKKKIYSLQPLRENQSTADQFSECMLKSAGDWARNAVADFAAIDGYDRNDFGARAEQENFLKLE